MAQWATFAGITGVVLVLLLVLSHLTQTAFSDGDDSTASRGTDRSQSPSSPSQRSPPPEASDSHASARVGGDEPSIDSREADSSESADERRDESGDDASDTDSATGDDAGVESEPEAAPSTESATDATADGERPTPAERPSPAERTLEDRSIRAPSERPKPADEGTEFDAPSRRGRGRQQRRGVDPESLSTGELLANVALSQGLFACVLLGAVVYTGIPADALGIEFSTAYLRDGLVSGTAVGLVLYVANELGAAAATRFGFDHDEQLRSLLAPDSSQGWLVLLLAVLPLIAVFEELLFRAALIGVISSGFAVSPWLLAIVSSIAFAVGHGMQGSIGVVVTGLLGFVLAAVFIVTGSFLIVVVAHYLVNALEFAVHEGLEFDWTEALEGEAESENDGHS